MEMELFNIICGVCSVLGLAVSVFAASKVIKKVRHVNKHNTNNLKGVNIGGDFVGRDKKTGK